jgi:hypothetical protein
MTEKYFIGTTPRISGSHTVHKHGCPFLPESGRRIDLGVFQSSKEAIKEGRGFFKSADSCPFCLKDHDERKKTVFNLVKADTYLVSSCRMKKVPWLNLMFCSLS